MTLPGLVLAPMIYIYIDLGYLIQMIWRQGLSKKMDGAGDNTGSEPLQFTP